MRLIQYRFQPAGEYLEVVAGGDLHVGHPQYLHEKAKKYQQYILASPDRVTIDLGDPTENSLRDSVGSGVYEQTMRPRDQKRYVREYYRDIAGQGKLLGICESNHAERSVKASDDSPTEELCEKLQTEFIRYQAVLAITVGNSAKGFTYLLHVRHFCGNASTAEGVQRQLKSKSQKVQGCDVHLAAHCHIYTHSVEPMYMPDPRHGKIRIAEKHFATCSSFIDYSCSYAEGKDYTLPPFGMVGIKLYRDKRMIDVERLV